MFGTTNGMNRQKETPTAKEWICEPSFRFKQRNTILFVTGAPLVGKSTITPLVTAAIDDCGLQNMDILRLTAQQIEVAKPEDKRNPFVNYGSCDSYSLIGDGRYSPESLLEGFSQYAQVVSSGLDYILPKLEVQGAQNVLFEGVQLMPKLVGEYLQDNNRLVIVKSDRKRLNKNRKKIFNNDELLKRYAADRLLLLQDELLRQARGFLGEKVFVVDNSGDYIESVRVILEYLLGENIIEEI